MAAIVLLALLFLIRQSCSSPSQPRVLSMPLQRRSHHSAAASLVKRNGFNASLQTPLPNDFYFGTVGVGTPPQLVELLIGTNIGDTWMFGAGACQANSGCLGGGFSLSQSTTSDLRTDLGQFNESYVSGAVATGSYFNDNAAIGGMVLKNITMGLATIFNGINSGAIGLGFSTLEVRAIAGSSPYQNLPDQLVLQGLTKSRCYSLYLADPDRATGTLLFGGYDTEKFSGPLTFLPVEHNPFIAVPVGWFVSLTGFGVNAQNQDDLIQSPHDPFPMLVQLDSGTPYIYMPLEFVLQFQKAFDLKQSDSIYDPFQVDCDKWRQLVPGAVLFIFGSEDNGVTIPVPFREMIIPVYNDNGIQETLENGKPYCIFALVAQSGEQVPSFGLPFLRYAYSFYSIDAQAVGLAPVKADNGKSHIVEYSNVGRAADAKTDTYEPAAHTINYAASSYSAKISAAKVTILTSSEHFDNAKQTSSFPTSVPTGLTPAADTIPTSTRGSHTSSSSPVSSGGSSNLGVEVGVPVGVVGGLVILGLAFFFWRRSSRRAKRDQEEDSTGGEEAKVQQTPQSGAALFAGASEAPGSPTDPSKSPPAPSYTAAEGFYGEGISDKPPVLEEVSHPSRVVSSEYLAPSEQGNLRESHLSGTSTITEIGGGATSPVEAPAELPGHPVDATELPVQTPATSELPEGSLRSP